MSSTQEGDARNTSVGDERTHEASKSSALGTESTFHLLASHGVPDLTYLIDSSTIKEYDDSARYGTVYSSHLRDNTRIAIKTLRFTSPLDKDSKALKGFIHELYTWAKCDHPNILRFLGFAQVRGSLAVLSPWMDNGRLTDFLSRNSLVSRHELCIQIASAVHYLHEHGIVHGDIKGSKILVSAGGIPQLSLFNRTSLERNSVQFSLGGLEVVSVRWSAPEVLLEESGITQYADVYSLGMTILEAITGSLPYANLSSEYAVIRFKILKRQPDRPPVLLNQNPQAELLWSLLQSCWSPQPSDRPSAAEVVHQMRSLSSLDQGGSNPSAHQSQPPTGEQPTLPVQRADG